MKRFLSVFLMVVCALAMYAQKSVDNTKSVRQDNAEAQYILGLQYYYGKGGKPQSYAEAVKWFTLSAEQGYAGAQCFLGVCYEDGTGVPQSDAEAVKWYRRAALSDDAQAQFFLGSCYYRGTGVEKQYSQAASWYLKSAMQGNADAQLALGQLYYDGEGVEKSYAEAAKWYTKSAMHFNEDAQYLLGCLYYDGKGVEKSHSKAMEWFRLAENGGCEVPGLKIYIAELEKEGVEQTSTNVGGSQGTGERLLTVCSTGTAQARLAQLMNYPFGCVDIDVNQSTVPGVCNYLKQHFGVDLYDVSMPTFVSWTPITKPLGYNVTLNGKKIEHASFYNSGSFRKLTYQMSELKTQSSFTDHKAYATELKKELESMGFTFGVLEDDVKELEIESDKINGVKVNIRCGDCSTYDLRDSWFTEISFIR